ncbi:MAG: acetyl-CoA carboxylase biotin carboxyl carrier protein subunit [Bacteroidales bacterium]|nr:acetyl-CoA carboxylase biotin carboxyl carrier protein subunit [Bacteroidales bacterium]MCF8389286.1 acetyl-CoA carboxylase biotin carboxyl carrier protein subunit [Bacteroidales bacterium]
MVRHNGKTQKDKFYACTPKGKNYEVVNPLGEKVKVKGKSLSVTIVNEPGNFTYLIYKKKKYQLEILEKNQNKYTVMINGVWYNFSIETPISYKRMKTLSKTQVLSRVEKITAPMPGKILDIMVEEGSQIKEGEALFILEAMKMQNEIVSNVSGKLGKINFRQNDNVMKDDIILEIERA